MLTVRVTHATDGRPLAERERAARSRVLRKQGAFIRRKALDLVRKVRRSKRNAKADPAPKPKRKLTPEQLPHVKAWYQAKRLMDAAERREKKPASRPGSPPLSHPPFYRLRLIRFAYDPQTGSVVAGPVIWPSSKTTRSLRALEEGGMSPGLDLEGKRVNRQVYIRPRPYMSRALEIEMANPRFMAVWEDSM